MCRPHALVLSCATGLIAAGYIALAVFQHRHFLTHAHDLGIFDQGVWQISRFQRPAMTVRFMPLPNMFGDHFHPIILVLVPWYWVFESPLVLLVAQALLFAATVPLGFLVARQLVRRATNFRACAMPNTSSLIRPCVDFGTPQGVTGCMTRRRMNETSIHP